MSRGRRWLIAVVVAAVITASAVWFSPVRLLAVPGWVLSWPLQLLGLDPRSVVAMVLGNLGFWSLLAYAVLRRLELRAGDPGAKISA